MTAPAPLRHPAPLTPQPCRQLRRTLANAIEVIGAGTIMSQRHAACSAAQAHPGNTRPSPSSAPDRPLTATVGQETPQGTALPEAPLQHAKPAGTHALLGMVCGCEPCTARQWMHTQGFQIHRLACLLPLCPLPALSIGPGRQHPVPGRTRPRLMQRAVRLMQRAVLLWCASLVCTFPVPRRVWHPSVPEMRRPRPIQAMQAARLAEGLPGAVGAGDVVRALRRQQPPRDLLRMQWPRLADLAVQREPPRHNLLHAQPLSPPPGPPPVRDDKTHGAAARWMRRVHERATHAWHACAAWLPADPERTCAGGYA